MGNTCHSSNQQCCIPQDAVTEVNVAADLTSEHLEVPNFAELQKSMSSGASIVQQAARTRPELPTLMLRRDGDTYREQQALAKVAALPSWYSDSTMGTPMATPVGRGSKRFSLWIRDGHELSSPADFVMKGAQLPEGSPASERSMGHKSSPLGFSPLARVSEDDQPKQSSKHPCLELVFDANGEEVKCHVWHRPLGAEFCRRWTGGPTKVSKVAPGSYASDLGLELGWALKSIAGADVSKKSLKDTQAALVAGLESLPLHTQD